jgi:hypothetical protein
VDNGRLLILKSITDHTGAKINTRRIFPEFESSQKNKSY